ncbi:MAG: 50S ribosomal protein L23 [Candidatus Yanofskybacteria bacterium]|nr:50S ribosomal protein L23 [Candidatus Yanofskybacteria bacterium]
MSALFSKKTKDEKKEALPQKSEVVVEETKQTSSFNPVQESVITSFYISEKAGLLNGFNQYVFKVSDNANKSQLSRQVEKMFSVKVKSVKMMNTKKKRRDIGKYTGFKPGFKKAVVVLEKGHSIEQAKA